jgi:ketopantoate reductase
MRQRRLLQRGAQPCKPSIRGAGANSSASAQQDALQDRAMETEALLGQVADFGRRHDVATSPIDVVLALPRGLDQAFRR